MFYSMAVQFDDFCSLFVLDDKSELSQKLYQSYQSSYFFAQYLQESVDKLKTIDWERLETLESLHALLSDCTLDMTAEAIEKKLRQIRKGICAKLIFQQQHGYAHFEQVAWVLSTLAKELLKKAYIYTKELFIAHYQLLETPSDLMILAMGKLGGNELNFSSDIDLVFLYGKDQHFERKNGKTLSSLQFYTKVGQKLIAMLDSVTADGFVYRVDMRLRPFGEGAPLVVNVANFSDYLIKHAREWERYAYVKADIITGENHQKAHVKSMIESFVYRHYLDFKMISSIRNMKQMIIDEMALENLKENIKLGRGGIREIEFICQCFQLVYGGQNKHLQTCSLKEALFTLSSAEHIEEEEAEILYREYILLRDIENALQMFDDRQVHSLPKEEIHRAKVANLARFEDWTSLVKRLACARENIQKLFDKLTHFSAESALVEADEVVPNSVSSLVASFAVTDQYTADIQLFLDEHPLTEDVLNIFYLLIEKAKERNLVSGVESVLQLFRVLYRRKTYLYLLCEKQSNLDAILEIFSYGKRLKNTLLKHPFLLENILNTQCFNCDEFSLESLKNKLISLLEKIDLNDTEQYLERLRQFKIEQVFNISVAELQGRISLMQSSDSFSYLATVITESVLKGAWREVFKYQKFNEETKAAYINSFAVIAYGKLGGLELSVSSDLDLVFLIDDVSALLKRSVYIRVIQKFTHYMQIQTYHGTLYEIDLRLRPDGEQGLLVHSIDGYKAYQRKSAWTWEHQALTRARFIAGGKKLKIEFDQIRLEVLRQVRDIEQLEKDVLSMRQKMRSHHLQVEAGVFDLKQSAGGMIDIEFIAQFYALAYSQSIPAIAYFSDSIRIIQTVETAKLISQQDAECLINNYCYYRQCAFYCYLDEQKEIVDVELVKNYAKEVINIWNKTFCEGQI